MSVSPQSLEVEADALLWTTDEQRSTGRHRSAKILAVAGVVLIAVGLIAVKNRGEPSQEVSVAPFQEVLDLAATKPLRGGESKNVDKLPASSGSKHVASAKQVKRCSWPLENCTDSQCCQKPGQQCYRQNNKTNYATCMQSCTQGPHPTHWDGEWWECTELGPRTDGSSKCAKMGEDCSSDMCCEETNTQCFKKTEGWATCKSQCDANGPDLTDIDSNPWTCEKLGPWTQGAAPWVGGQCSPDGEDCRATHCCQGANMQCYEQTSDWAACKPSCTPGKDPERFWEPEWTCKELGVRSPGYGPPAVTTVSSWVKDFCAWEGDDCSKSRCCLGMNKQCYAKNKDWAVCKEDCTPGKNPYDNNETWSCEPMGPRSVGLPLRGSPSLFCWSLFQTTTYEMDVMKNQMGGGRGIFLCDDWALLSTAEPTVLGTTPDGVEAKTLHVDMAEITTSVDGTAGNAKLFINCWNVLIQDGRWNLHAWTVKVDPDAVLVPDRLRVHLAPHVMENVYVVNCNAFPGSPNFPMMYGSLEIYSWKAIQTYANSMTKCMDDMGMMLPAWGEDYFMTHCLDHIGVGRIADFASVGDGVCTGVNCADAWVAAFHPFKSVDAWQQCWDTAMR